jgi:NitT/TauT family transport system permease protein
MTKLARGRENLLAIGLPLAAALLVGGAWQAAVRLTDIPALVFPAPSEIGGDFMATLPLLLRHAAVSGLEAFGAFLIAVGVGFIGAAIITASRLVRELVYPNLVVLQILPKVALAPLFVVWLGIDSVSRVTFAAFLTFFPVLISTALGLQNTDRNVLRLSHALTASPWQIFWQIRVPFALPHFFAGVKIGATMAMTGIVVAEFVTARAGLGFVILTASARSETAEVFAAILMLCFVGLALYGAVALIETGARRWYRG